MTKDEARAIFLELKKVYPHAAQIKSRETLSAYGAVLQKYNFDAVMKNTRNYIVSSKFFPAVSDLVCGLTAEDGSAERQGRNSPAEWMLPHIDALFAAVPKVSPTTRLASERGCTCGAVRTEVEESNEDGFHRN